MLALTFYNQTIAVVRPTAGKGYYPYVKQCPGGWQKIPARPSGQ